MDMIPSFIINWTLLLVLLLLLLPQAATLRAPLREGYHGAPRRPLLARGIVVIPQVMRLALGLPPCHTPKLLRR